jgi:hypothetical protein
MRCLGYACHHHRSTRDPLMIIMVPTPGPDVELAVSDPLW